MKFLVSILITAIYTVAFLGNTDLLACLISIHCFVNYVIKHYEPLEYPSPNYSMALDVVFNAEFETEPFTVTNYGNLSYGELQKLVKSNRRHNSQIKLNSKKSKLIE